MKTPLQVRNLTIRYRSGARRFFSAVDGVSFDTGKVETLGLIGGSGCANASVAPASHRKETPGWSDKLLVDGCLRCEEGAWSALIDKYKNLIFSIPIKYGFSRDDASDIFQAVCLAMLSELPKLRDVKALPKWIMQVTSHKCFQHRRQLARLAPVNENEELPGQVTPAVVPHILRQAEEEQTLREALSVLPPRCQQLIHMLFFEESARPYRIIAAELGLAPGSIGFIRQRCLDRLRKRLEDAGFS